MYTHKGDNLDFYSCASKLGINVVNGRIYDSMGFVGTWYCADAVTTVAGLAATTVLLAMF